MKRSYYGSLEPATKKAKENQGVHLFMLQEYVDQNIEKLNEKLSKEIAFGLMHLRKDVAASFKKLRVDLAAEKKKEEYIKRKEAQDDDKITL